MFLMAASLCLRISHFATPSAAFNMDTENTPAVLSAVDTTLKIATVPTKVPANVRYCR